jgi:hypothetical protein
MKDLKGRAPFGAVMLLSAALVGCSATTRSTTTAEVAPAPAPRRPGRPPRAVSPGLVKLFAGFAPTEPRLVLGSVTVNIRGDALQAAAALKRAASKMGADAVVQMKLTKAGDISRTSLSGLAVRFTP